jgi:L-cysteine:1D-myo-inositol 2-amino-2-deoxy-alpha-D-glucopyranoside ligase
MYVCDIRPYATMHLGHAFTYAGAAVLIRYLEDQGYRVRYVQNLTDVDDAILREAHRVGEDWHELGHLWTAHFSHDMQRLDIRPPDLFPWAADMIVDIIATVHKLTEAEMAYVACGSVYFNVDGWPD